MTKSLILFTWLLLTQTLMGQTSLYDLSFTDINGNTVELSTFKGKKILFVNVASECGYTPQYTELQALHEQYGDKVTLIGFPCDQFGGQEPGTEAEIQSFCQKNFGVTFLMASKIDVKGDDQHPIYQWLSKAAVASDEKGNIRWNFEKFLVDEEGNFMEHFRSGVTPLSEEITSLLD